MCLRYKVGDIKGGGSMFGIFFFFFLRFTSIIHSQK